MGISLGLAAALVAGVGAGAAAATQGVQTPGGAVLSGAGVGEFDVGTGVPDLPAPEEISTDVDQSAIRRARTAEAERIRKRRGRASTIQRKKAGLLSSPAETTGTLGG